MCHERILPDDFISVVSNLVFPLAHLNILISAEFSFLSFLRPYVIAVLYQLQYINLQHFKLENFNRSNYFLGIN